jgi:hypothetical protein
MHAYQPRVRPDGYGLWAEGGVQVPVFVEYDSGGEQLDVLVDKLPDYRHLFAAIGRVWPVLFWLPTAARERNLRRLPAEAPPPCRSPPPPATTPPTRACAPRRRYGPPPATATGGAWPTSPTWPPTCASTPRERRRDRGPRVPRPAAEGKAWDLSPALSLSPCGI